MAERVQAAMAAAAMGSAAEAATPTEAPSSFGPALPAVAGEGFPSYPTEQLRMEQLLRQG